MIPATALELAYFSMEMMLETDIPTYAGGLGVLAGDILRSAADKKVSAVGITLVYSGNAFDQKINPDGTQVFSESHWQKLDQLIKMPQQIKLVISNTEVTVGCWRYDIVGIDGFVVPVYLLDTDFYGNPPWARNITKNLYGGGADVRLSQEVVLGIGGVKMLRALGYTDARVYHLNEGHCAFATLGLLEENGFRDEVVRQMCVFTTHTPVPEGHDHFDYDLAYRLAGKYLPWHIKSLATAECLSMTDLAMNLSHCTLAVSQKHKQVTEHLFPGRQISSITNGVHHRSWVCPVMQNVLETHLPGWAADPSFLRMAPGQIPDQAIWDAHQDAKRDLINYVNKHLTSIDTEEEKQQPTPRELFDVDTITIALGRRPVAYKRPLLLYRDLDRFIRIGVGKIQIIQCGKSHPADTESQEFVRQIIDISKRLRGILRVVYLENYSPKIARFLVAGSDVWLNTPRRPLEASGTSGMKAALNGSLNFSVLDGWWIEGYHMYPDSGFSIGPESSGVTPDNNDDADANDLYTKLQNQIIPLYYDRRTDWIRRMKQAIALGSYFNTHRVLDEHRRLAWHTA